LPFEEEQRSDLDSLFCYVAENAAKTAYNCSGCEGAFDEDGFEWLLKCAEEFGRRSEG